MRIPRLAPSRRPERTSSRPPVLVLNTYAGSLLLAAKSLKLDIVGSYEDCGFGSEFQAVNFPELEGLMATTRDAWPEENDLRETVVIGHPPCAGFSNMSKALNTGGRDTKGGHGKASKHFAQTVDVCNYSLSRQCAALMVESVTAACEGARDVHDALAEEHGYHLFRVLQNAATFGIPQWRPRFWAVFVRKDLCARLALTHEPVAKTVAQVLEETPGGDDVDERFERRMRQQIALLRKGGRSGRPGDRPLTEEEIAQVLSEPGLLAANISKLLKLDEPTHETLKHWCLTACGKGDDVCARFLVDSMRILPLDGCASVILETGWFVANGKSLTPTQYKALNGFPTDYRLDKKYLMWLSKGVVPPVAAWLLDQVVATVEAAGKGEHRDLPLTGVTWIEPGGIGDFTVTRAQWEALRDGRTVADEEDRPASSPRATSATVRSPKGPAVAWRFFFDRKPTELLLRGAFETKAGVPDMELLERQSGGAEAWRVACPEALARKAHKMLAGLGVLVTFERMPA